MSLAKTIELVLINNVELKLGFPIIYIYKKVNMPFNAVTFVTPTKETLKSKALISAMLELSLFIS